MTTPTPSLLDEVIAILEAKSRDLPPLPEVDFKMIQELDLSSCDFCPSGCTDDDCYRCYSPLRPENLRTFAKNLVAAAMRCRSWQLRDKDPAWRPGCAIDGLKTA